MRLDALIRQTHRWTCILFTLTVIVDFIALALQSTRQWLFYLPLPFLFVLLFTGLWMFALPYLGRRRTG